MLKESLSEPRRGTVLVTDADRGSALAIIRSLGRQGWRVIAADSDPRSLGFRSRYAQDRLLYPAPTVAPQAFVDTLYDAVREKEIDLVLPVTDEVLHLLAHARARFEEVCQLALADAAALELVTDKSKTLELAERLGVPIPSTRVVQTFEEAREAARSLRCPVVLKPALSSYYLPERGVIESCSVCYAKDLKDLSERMHRFEGRYKVLLQEYCPGIGHGVEMLAYRGQPVAAFQHKRLAEIPISGGASAWRESVPLDPTLYTYASRLVDALEWTGLIMVEFKVGKDVRLMEINGRVWGSLPLAVLSGMDFPGRLAELYFGEPPVPNATPASEYKVGVRAFNLDLILLWIPQVLFGKQRYPFLPHPKRRQAVAAALGLLDPKQKWDIGSWEDPRPALAAIPKMARKLGDKLKKAMQSARRNDVNGF